MNPEAPGRQRMRVILAPLFAVLLLQGMPLHAASASPDSAAVVLAAVSASVFDPGAIPAASGPLPPFPFVDWPAYVPAEQRSVEREASLDALTLIAGTQLLTVEGRIERRRFAIPDGKSPLELRRYYRERITALGGAQVNRLQPISDIATVTPAVQALFPAGADPAVRLGLHSYDEGQYQYEAYVVRTAKSNAWFAVQTSTYTVIVTSLEQPLE